MGKFLQAEKPNQAAFKATAPYFSTLARSDGLYKTRYRPYCLPVEHAEENLMPEIRETALAHFAANNIKWHDGQSGKPSNHMCDSQVCCVNFLFPLADKPAALAEIFRPFFPEIEKMLPVENGLHVSFEWIGRENYLGEKKSPNRLRTRGANFTSTDAIVMFDRVDHKRQVVLIEWKYTESYFATPLKYAKSGTDRTAIYRHLFDQEDCSIDKALLLSYDDLFYEPFYQFMRQQFLAHEMEKAGELGADIVTLLHIAPDHNRDFHRITSRELLGLGESSVDVWKKLVGSSGRFMSVATEKMFTHLPVEQYPEIAPWAAYLHARYVWLNSEERFPSHPV